jgi:ribonuclease P protein component
MRERRLGWMPVAMARESGRRRGRLSRSGDFDRVFRDGSSHANRYLVLYAFPRADSEAGEAGEGTRLGISVGRKVGGAVERNRVKRVLREAFWALPEDALPAEHDFVLVARPELAELAQQEGAEGVGKSLSELFREGGFGQPGQPRG